MGGGGTGADCSNPPEIKSSGNAVNGNMGLTGRRYRNAGSRTGSSFMGLGSSALQNPAATTQTPTLANVLVRDGEPRRDRMLRDRIVG